MDKDITLTDVPAKADTLSLLDSPIENPDEKVLPDDQEETLPIKADEEEKEEKEEIDLGAAETEEEPKIEEDALDFTSISRKALIKEFPEIFKKFPQLETTIYKMRAFEEIFPTLKDARQAADSQKTLASVEERLAKGDVVEILDSIRTDSKDAFLRVIDNFLPSVYKLDEGAYTALMGNIAKFFIKDLYAAGNQFAADSEQQKLLFSAAKVFYQKVFGQAVWDEPKPLAKKTDEKKENTREQELMNARYEEVTSDVSERADNAIKAKLNEIIDPRGAMTEYVREKAIDDCLIRLEHAVNSDQNYKVKNDKLWQAAYEANFSKESQKAIIQFYFSKAQSVLPDIIKDVRAKALANLPKRVVKKSDEEENERVPSKPATRESRSDRKPSGRFHSDGRPKTTLEIINEE